VPLSNIVIQVHVIIASFIGDRLMLILYNH